MYKVSLGSSRKSTKVHKYMTEGEDSASGTGWGGGKVGGQHVDRVLIVVHSC